MLRDNHDKTDYITRCRQFMKKHIIILFYLFSISIVAQNDNDILKSIDTIQLSKFSPKSVISFEFRNAKISISQTDFLLELNEHRKEFKDSLARHNIKYKNYYFENAVTAIDSINNLVSNKSKSKEIIISSNRTCSQVGIDLFMRFDKYIDNKSCAIFDKIGKSQTSIIKKTIVENWGDDTVEATYYFIPNENDSFFIGIND